jgi:hypothetical protein
VRGRRQGRRRSRRARTDGAPDGRAGRIAARAQTYSEPGAMKPRVITSQSAAAMVWRGPL